MKTAAYFKKRNRLDNSTREIKGRIGQTLSFVLCFIFQCIHIGSKGPSLIPTDIIFFSTAMQLFFLDKVENSWQKLKVCPDSNIS